MRATVVGGGAMGGVLAGHLAAAGTPIAVVDVAPEVVAAIRATGLVLQTGRETETLWPAATTRPEEIGPCDVVFFFVKAHQTASAAALAQPLVGPDTTVVSLQNGWGNADLLAEVYPPKRLVMGVSYHSATVVGPGRVAHTGTGPTFLGPYVDGAPLERAEAVGALLRGAGMAATATPQVKTEVWKKLILNAATLPTSALTGLRAAELGQPGPMRDLVDAITAEAVAVACAQGYDVDASERVERIHAVLAGAGAGKASMLQDVEAQRKTEIEVINAAIVRAAERSGVDVPLNRAMVALIDGLERSWQR